MNAGELKLCMGCMHKIGEEKICPYCGYLEGTPYIHAYLPPKTVLQERYVVGKLLAYNGEGATYIGYDAALNVRVLIREYMPESLCQRVEEDHSLTIVHGCETQYKTYLSDFADLAKAQIKMRTISMIVPVLEVFSLNNTMYIVYEHVDAVPFQEYLMQNGGELTWAQTKALFLPFLSALNIIHTANIVHCGISPSTLFVDHTGKLRLFGFSIHAVRSAGSDLIAELFPGYAAPEQYTATSWQGVWTDVYAAAAVMYRALTGAMPPEAISRNVNDNLVPVSVLNKSVPQNVSNAIASAMAYSPNKRTESVVKFIDNLTATLDINHFVPDMGSETRVFKPVPPLRQTADDTRIYQPKPAAPAPPPSKAPKAASGGAKPEDKKGSPKTPIEDEKSPEETKKELKKHSLKVLWITAAILSVIVIIIVGFVLFGKGGSKLPMESSSSNSLNSGDSDTGSTVSPASTVERLVAPDLVGMKLDAAQTQYRGQFNLVVEYEQTADTPEGFITKQSPGKGAILTMNNTITVTVAQAPETVEVPNIIGYPQHRAKDVLDNNGIPYEIIEIYDASGEPGTVKRMDKNPGDRIDPKREKLTVFIVQEREESSSSSRFSLFD